MEDLIPIHPDYPLSRFSVLPEGWTGYTSAAALGLLLPRYYRQSFPAEARQLLLSGIDRYTGGYNEGDAADLLKRAEAYLNENLDPKKGYTLSELREMVRLHTGRLLEGRSREALTSAVYLATYVLSACGSAVTPEELWVFNEAMLGARPISSNYATVDSASPEELLLDPKMSSAVWGSSAYVQIPVGRHQVLFKLSQMDSLSFKNFVLHGYGMSPSWPLSASRQDGQWSVPLGRTVEALNTKIYPALAKLATEDPRTFLQLPELFCEAYLSGKATSAPNPATRALLASMELQDPSIVIRALEFVLGELRDLSRSARQKMYQSICAMLQPKASDPAVHLIATIAMGVFALGASGIDYSKKYFITK